MVGCVVVSVWRPGEECMGCGVVRECIRVMFVVSVFFFLQQEAGFVVSQWLGFRRFLLLSRVWKGSVPVADQSVCPAPDDIRAVLDRVHQQVLDDIGAMPEGEMTAPAGEPPHRMFRTKLGALRWCAQHEFISVV